MTHSHQVRVERSEKHLVAQDREPTIHPAAAGPNVPWQLTLVSPDGSTGARIQSEHPAILGGTVKGCRRLPAAWFQIFRWSRRQARPSDRPTSPRASCRSEYDLIQRAEPMRGIIT